MDNPPPIRASRNLATLDALLDAIGAVYGDMLQPYTSDNGDVSVTYYPAPDLHDRTDEERQQDCP